MGRIHTFRDLLGVIKDKASLSKAALFSRPNALSLRLAVIRATAHSPAAPPDDHRLSALLLLGEASRATACSIITALMDRLHRTGNSVVALKCLLIVHHIIKRGPFILQDQLSVFPFTGGRNYLKLSAFRDGATAVMWALSSWVRWYASYLETLLSSARVLGYFLGSSSSCSTVTEHQELRISSFLNADLIKDIDSLVPLVEAICKLPDHHVPEGDMLVKEIMGLLVTDYLSSVNEILLRLREAKERLNSLSFGDSVELVFAVKRLQNCKERLSIIYSVEKPSIETMWGLAEELEGMVEMLKLYEGGKLLSLGRREKATESDRFEQRGLVSDDSVRFQSDRFEVNRISGLLALDK